MLYVMCIKVEFKSEFMCCCWLNAAQKRNQHLSFPISLNFHLQSSKRQFTFWAIFGLDRKHGFLQDKSLRRQVIIWYKIGCLCNFRRLCILWGQFQAYNYRYNKHPDCQSISFGNELYYQQCLIIFAMHSYFLILLIVFY